MFELEPIAFDSVEFCSLYDELPLWSASFGLMLLERVPLKPRQTVLDIGAGTGFLSIELAERCGAGSTVYAVDPWKGALERLRWKCEQRKLSNVVLLEQDAANLKLPDGSVDVVVSNLGVNNFDDPAAVLRACYRIARPGAALVLTTNLVGHMAEFYDAYRAVLQELGQAERLPVLESHVDHRGTVDSVTALLEDAGFRQVVVECSSFHLRFADGSALLRHFFIRVGFLEAWMSIAAGESQREILDLLERKLNAIASERGELALTIPMACVTAQK